MQLTAKDIESLRASGRVMQHESVIKEGDMIFAVNPATGTRRAVDTSGLMLESARTLLKG